MKITKVTGTNVYSALKVQGWDQLRLAYVIGEILAKTKWTTEEAIVHAQQFLELLDNEGTASAGIFRKEVIGYTHRILEKSLSGKMRWLSRSLEISEWSWFGRRLSDDILIQTLDQQQEIYAIEWRHKRYGNLARALNEAKFGEGLVLSAATVNVFLESKDGFCTVDFRTVAKLLGAAELAEPMVWHIAASDNANRQFVQLNFTEQPNHVVIIRFGNAVIPRSPIDRKSPWRVYTKSIRVRTADAQKPTLVISVQSPTWTPQSLMSMQLWQDEKITAAIALRDEIAAAFEKEVQG